MVYTWVNKLEFLLSLHNKNIISSILMPKTSNFWEYASIISLKCSKMTVNSLTQPKTSPVNFDIYYYIVFTFSFLIELKQDFNLGM